MIHNIPRDVENKIQKLDLGPANLIMYTYHWHSVNLLKVVTDGGPGVVVEAACLESLRSRVRTPLPRSNFKETKCFFPAP